MPDNIPETGDVVIHSSESNATSSYAIYAVPGPDQFGCATRAEAERTARSCAKRCGVNLWFSEGPSSFTLLARFRRRRSWTTPANALHRWRDWRRHQSEINDGSVRNTMITEYKTEERC
jgi:hypothetical protein